MYMYTPNRVEYCYIQKWRAEAKCMQGGKHWKLVCDTQTHFICGEEDSHIQKRHAQGKCMQGERLDCYIKNLGVYPEYLEVVGHRDRDE